MKSKNLKLFYIHELIFQFSDSMLVIVLPIFIYKLFGSISAVFLFILAWNIFYAALFIPIFNLAMKLKKPQYFMAIGMGFYVISLILFSQITHQNKQMIIPTVIIFSLYISCYWLIRHWFFSTISDHSKIGKQISTLAIIKIGIGFLAPIIGGLLSYFISFNATFILGAIIGLLNILPILMFKTIPHPRNYNLKKIHRILKKTELKAIRPAYICEGISNIFLNNCWILAFAIFIGNILDLGLLTGATTLITGALIWITGKWFDTKKRTKILNRLTVGRVLSGLMYPFIFFFPNTTYIWITELINKFIISMHQTVVDSYLYAYSNKIHPIHFHLNREIHLIMSRSVGAIILMISFYFLSDEYLWIYIGLGTFTILGWLTLKRSDHLLH